MKVEDDDLRICSKCKSPIRFSDEGKKPCPKCGATVWFYNYRPLPPPPDLPRLARANVWGNPLTVALLASAVLFGLVALVGVAASLVVAAGCGLAVIGFIAFAVMRHQETLRIEQKLENAHRILEYAQAMQARLQDSASRYNVLLNTGNARIDHYFNDIYVGAEHEKREAASLRAQARADREAVRSVETRIHQMADRLVTDHRKWMTQKLRPDPENYQRRKTELQKTFDFVESLGYVLPKDIRETSQKDLKSAYLEVVRQQQLRDEQRRLNQQARDEARLQEEAEREIAEAEQKEAELQIRLERALQQHRGMYDAEIEDLKQQLAEAHERAERAKSMAQLTKVGHVYVLSNIGSFGEQVFKVGMTRRIDPDLRVHELGDASVPFPFDVHVMIRCDNAPALEHALHNELTRYRVNRVNLRKEFFRADLETILDVIRQNHGEVEYVAEPEALQYRMTETMSPEDVVELENELEEAGVTLDDSDE
jgi:hypothetical protein